MNWYKKINKSPNSADGWTYSPENGQYACTKNSKKFKWIKVEEKDMCQELRIPKCIKYENMNQKVNK